MLGCIAIEMDSRGPLTIIHTQAYGTDRWRFQNTGLKKKQSRLLVVTIMALGYYFLSLVLGFGVRVRLRDGRSIGRVRSRTAREATVTKYQWSGAVVIGTSPPFPTGGQ